MFDYLVGRLKHWQQKIMQTHSVHAHRHATGHLKLNEFICLQKI